MYKIFTKLINYLNDGQYKEFFKLLFILLPFITLVFMLIALAIGFISRHIEAIVFLAIIIVCIISWILKPTIEQEKKEEVKIIPKSTKPIQLQYQLVTEFMFHILKSLNTQLHIVSPNFESQIKDKIPYYTDNATNVTYFRYNMIINGEPLESELFKEILNQGIIHNLSSSTSKLGRPTFEHDGNHYQKLMIEELVYTGASWLIVVAIVDNDYAAVLENRSQMNHFIATNSEDFTFHNDRDF